MQIGPLTQTDFNKIKTILEEAGHSFSISFEEGSTEDPKKLMPEPSYNNHPTYVSTIPYIYMDVPTEALLLIKGELDRMAVPIVSRQSELASDEELHCPRCKFVSETPGKCPKHGLQLVDYLKWCEIRSARRDKVSRWLAVLALASLAATIGGGAALSGAVLSAGAIGLFVCGVAYVINVYI